MIKILQVQSLNGKAKLNAKRGNKFDYSELQNAVILHKKGRKNSYLNIVCAFDIETTTIEQMKTAFMYIWQFQIGTQIVIGRTWIDFMNFIDNVRFHIKEDCKLVVYVHNLSYEFMFLKSVIPVTSIMATDNRKIIKFDSGQIEFRCSYYLSNMNLEKFVISAGGQYQKQSGFDYRKKRYPDTVLTESELKYCVYDVLALCSALTNKMQKDGDDLATIPLTSTGYVRRIFKKIMQPFNRMVKYELPDLMLFDALRNAFRGGNTHANRYNAGVILHNVHSYDISSSYPSVMLSESFPARFELINQEEAEQHIKDGKAVLMQIDFYDVKLNNELWGCPYFAKAKIPHVINADLDNGRILSADALLGGWYTEVDFQIISDEYRFNYKINIAYSAYKKKLPAPFRAQILELYKAKTELKNIDGKEYFYAREKEHLNSTYGMMVTSPLKKPYVYIDGVVTEDETKTREFLIDEYHKHGWLPYQYGVYVTCYARQKLEAGLNIVRDIDFVYADTDSIKTLGNYDIEFEELNKRYKDYRYSALDSKKIRHYCGIFETENIAQQFCTLGAKKYVYVDENNKLHTTIAGVSKKEGADELKSIENFKPGFVFSNSAGMEAVYNDEIQMRFTKINGHEVCITSNIALLPSCYTLGLTEDYERLINYLLENNIKHTLYFD